MKQTLWRGQLFVRSIESDSKYKDVVRVPQSTFRDARGFKANLEKNEIYRLTANKRTVLVALRGARNPGISMDQITRERLGVHGGRSYHFEFEDAGLLGQFQWAWGATDPAYRIASRLGALSLVLGVIGAVLGAWSLYLTLNSSPQSPPATPMKPYLAVVSAQPVAQPAARPPHWQSGAARP